MDKQEKKYTIEVTEHELARVLFIMRNANGKDYGRSLTSIAMEKLGAKDLGFNHLHTKAIELARSAKIPTFMNYCDIQKEWEEFLGINKTDQTTPNIPPEVEIEVNEVNRVGHVNYYT